MSVPTRSRRRLPQQPTAVVRAHIEWLLAEGMTRQAVTADTGVADRTLYGILKGSHRHVKGGTAAVILAARPRPNAQAGLVPAVGTVRRLRALVTFGYLTSHLAADTGLAHSGIHHLAIHGQERVDVTTRNAVAAHYERLSATPGPSDNARRFGRVHGWAVPAAWDDIDNPDEVPAGLRSVDPRTLVHRVLAGDAHIALLTVGQEASLWRRWSAGRRADGLPVTGRQFASEFGITQRKAARIIAAAQQTPTTAAEGRTNRKVA